MLKYAIDAQGIATITLDRDEKRNAINAELARQLLERLDDAVASGARVIVVRANAGARVWCAGHDLSELTLESLHAENPTLAVVERIQAIPIPVIAMVEGAVYAGGLLILLSADIVIATPNAEVAITSNKLGIPLPPELLAYFLRVMGLHKAKELLFTAHAISADDAYQAGLYNTVIVADRLEEMVYELANRIVGCSAEAIAHTKSQLNLLAGKTGLDADEFTAVNRLNEELLANPETVERLRVLRNSMRGS